MTSQLNDVTSLTGRDNKSSVCDGICDVNRLQYGEKRTLAVFRDLCIRKQTTRAEVMRPHANEQVNKGGFTQLIWSMLLLGVGGAEFILF